MRARESAARSWEICIQVWMRCRRRHRHDSLTVMVLDIYINLYRFNRSYAFNLSKFNIKISFGQAKDGRKRSTQFFGVYGVFLRARNSCWNYKFSLGTRDLFAHRSWMLRHCLWHTWTRFHGFKQKMKKKNTNRNEQAKSRGASMDRVISCNKKIHQRPSIW